MCAHLLGECVSALCVCVCVCVCAVCVLCMLCYTLSMSTTTITDSYRDNTKHAIDHNINILCNICNLLFKMTVVIYTVGTCTV